MESHLPPNISSFVIRFVVDSDAGQNPFTYYFLDDAFNEMNAAIEAWCTENGIEFEF